MTGNRKIGVFLTPNRKPWPHEMRVANILALAGHYVEFLPENQLHTADIRLDGVEYEIKSPESFNSNTLEHKLKDATKQSPNLIIDSSRMRGIRDDKIRMFLTNQARKQKQIKKMLFITKKGQIIDIFGLL